MKPCQGTGSKIAFIYETNWNEDTPDESNIMKIIKIDDGIGDEERPRR